jgi:hypothetical protein
MNELKKNHQDLPEYHNSDEELEDFLGRKNAREPNSVTSSMKLD